MDSNTLMWVFGQICAAAAVYGGIRADIAAQRARLEHTEKSVTEAHTRIDRILEGKRGG